MSARKRCRQLARQPPEYMIHGVVFEFGSLSDLLQVACRWELDVEEARNRGRVQELKRESFNT